nr:MAG TPA_asm: hypothetical protein [Caudoviricetes sp.]
MQRPLQCQIPREFYRGVGCNRIPLTHLRSCF